eukprot:2797544-Prymnesium_polylepis.1
MATLRPAARCSRCRARVLLSTHFDCPDHTSTGPSTNPTATLRSCFSATGLRGRNRSAPAVDSLTGSRSHCFSFAS